MIRKMRRLVAVTLLCVSGLGVATATHQLTHATGVGWCGTCCPTHHVYQGVCL